MEGRQNFKGSSRTITFNGGTKLNNLLLIWRYIYSELANHVCGISLILLSKIKIKKKRLLVVAMRCYIRAIPRKAPYASVHIKSVTVKMILSCKTLMIRTLNIKMTLLINKLEK